MISCKEVAEKFAKSEEIEQGLMEAFQLKFHMFICTACKRYKKHMKSLNIGANKLFNEFVTKNEKDIKQIEADCLEMIKKNLK